MDDERPTMKRGKKHVEAIERKSARPRRARLCLADVAGHPLGNVDERHVRIDAESSAPASQHAKLGVHRCLPIGEVVIFYDVGGIDDEMAMRGPQVCTQRSGVERACC